MDREHLGGVDCGPEVRRALSFVLDSNRKVVRGGCSILCRIYLDSAGIITHVSHCSDKVRSLT